MPLRDHDVPPLYILILFCEKATAWLNQDGENLVAVHCRGGKGRTGIPQTQTLNPKIRDRENLVAVHAAEWEGAELAKP
jgi:hypothetical protein